MDIELEYGEPIQKPVSRCRKRSKLQIFKEAYLPLIIVVVTLVLTVIFIVGGIRRGTSADNPTESTPPSQSTQPSESSSSTTEDPNWELQLKAEELMAQAALLLDDYDYAGALAILDTFPGDRTLFPQLNAVYNEYQEALDSMVAWQGSQVMNLSFHLLIADPERAFNDDVYGRQYRNNFITTTEFSAILQQLYDNNYILVSLSDLYELVQDESSGRNIYVAKTLLLAPGKTPILLTETNANYYTYMTDSNGDGKPDAGADGFAYKLCYDGSKFFNEYVMSDGTVTTGAYDMVPLLEEFIEKHPDFSYRDARAIIAFSGYDGVLGYRINSTKLTPAQQEEEKQALVALVEALRNTGYEIASYTFGNKNYADLNEEDICNDLQKWEDNITSVIGNVDILVLPKEGNIAGNDETLDANHKFNIMKNFGFSFFLGTGTTAWDQVDEFYVRHDRLMVTGEYLRKYPDRFTILFDAEAVLDPYRANFG